MSGRYLLDTNIVIAVFADEVALKSSWLGPGSICAEHSPRRVYYGAQKSSRIASNVARVDEFAANNSVLVCDAETARQYGEVKNELRAKEAYSRE